MTQDNRLLLLGHISAAHGLRGEVLIKTHTGEPQAIGAYGPLTDESGEKSFALKVLRVTDKGVIARIQGVSDRTAAEALRGVKLLVPRAKLPPAAQGEYYHADLIGLTVLGDDGAKIGWVVAVQNFGAGDLLEIRLEGSRQTEFVPFTDASVPNVDVAAGQLVVRFPDVVEGEDEPDPDLETDPGSDRGEGGGGTS